MAAYVKEFDDKSAASVIGIAGTYSTTDSWFLTAFPKLHFLEDQHRLMIAAATGEVRNDYSDFFPAGGGGLFYNLNDQGMVVRADVVFGKKGNHGYYLKFGDRF